MGHGCQHPFSWRRKWKKDWAQGFVILSVIGGRRKIV
ncbi:DUF2256 domain-containing protein [Psychrobacter sp. 72-O-c]|nr:DUF2256 domain-containing protein [Psychrobacter sp. 72-O-c]